MDSTAAKSLRGLEWLCQHEGPAGVTEMSVALGVSKSNAHRILRTLTALGYARSLDDGRYEATLRTWEIGSAVLARSDVKEVARPIMSDLSKKTEESVHLSILDGREVVYIDKIESNQPVRAYSRIGGRAPAYAVATGKALLAFCDGKVEALLPKRLQAFTRHTVVQRQEFMKALDEIRRNGYAVNRGEWREDVCGVAAPIRDERNEVVAAIGISGPSSRLTPARMRACAVHVLASAQQISAQLGHRPVVRFPMRAASAERAKRSLPAFRAR